MSKQKTKLIVVAAVAVVIVIVVILAIVLASKDDDDNASTKSTLTGNEAEKYTKAAVATDNPKCSEIGRDILKNRGSAVDAAIACLLCVGVVNVHSTGIGGGGFMIVYANKIAKAYDYRETAPSAANQTMYLKNGTSSRVGGLAIAIPGEIKGLYMVHQKYGTLPWKDLFEPSAKLAEDGFEITHPVDEAIQGTKDQILANPGMKSLLFKNGKFLVKGDTLKNPELATTLRAIAKDPHSFYNGSIATQIAKDITDNGGIITFEDMQNYKVEERDVLKSDLQGLTINAMPPPSSGAVLIMILNILRGYNFKMADLSTDAKKADTFHKFVEAYKWAYARRALLGDPNFVPADNMTRAMSELLNHTVADQIRLNKIINNATFNASYYGGYYGVSNFGTSHISILAENGDAVAATSTINWRFGAFVRSPTLGILYNNEMDDFSTPGLTNIYGYSPTPANYVAAGKRPMSSMCPTIVTDSNGDVKMIAGASGGSMIITGTAQTIIKKLFFNMELGSAVSNPRVHHQLLPNYIWIDSGNRSISDETIRLLEKKGHVVKKEDRYCVVQSIYKEGPGNIFAKSDPRKHSKSAGYD